VTTLRTDDSPTQNEGLVVLTHNLVWADRGRAELRFLDLGSQDFDVLATNQDGIQTVATDGSTFYWAHAGGIRRLAGGTAENVHTSPGAYALAYDGGELFWVTTGGVVFKGAPSGGGSTLLGAQAPPNAGEWSAVSIALDAKHVYFTARVALVASDEGADGVWRVSRSQGGVEPVAVGTPSAEGLALSPSCIYWGSRSGSGSISVRDKNLGSSPESLGGFDYPRGLAISQTHLYFADSLAGVVGKLLL
jgi:hypothetical protein